MDFELTEGQKQAMGMFERVMKTPPPLPTVMTGFAGTGKTTLLGAIASAFGPPKILAPTGKASLRVGQATGLDSSTIHRWLYQPMENQKTGEIEFRRKDSNMIEVPSNKLVVVDEASMVGRKLWEDLWDMCQLMGLRVLLVGDTFQLSPVEPSRGEDEKPFAPLSDIDTKFRAHLDEVTRQALDNPIFRASMLLREQPRVDRALALLKRVFSKNFDDKCMQIYQEGGAILVHKNDTRHRINKMIRDRLGYGEDLREGEPLLVLRNNYDLDRFNGEVIKYEGWQKYDATPKAVRDNWRNIALMLTFGIAKVDGQEALLCPEQVHGTAATMTESVIAKNSRQYFGDWYADEMRPYSDDEGNYVGPPHLHANFGYSLTTHKSQGSEWDQGLVLIENSTRPNTYEGRRWLYTAITRFKQHCFFTMEA